jgi:hypothetical protein
MTKEDETMTKAVAEGGDGRRRSKKLGQGRINVTVRFTPERHAILKAAAEANGRSLSEQIEYQIERESAEAAFKSAARFNAELRALSEKRIGQIIEDTVTRMLAGADREDTAQRIRTGGRK